MSELYDSADYIDLNFEYVGPTKDVSFYEYRDSKELFNAIKNSQIKFVEAKNKENEFLNKLGNIKIGKKTLEQKEVINNLKKFYNSREEVIIFFRDYVEMLLDGNYKAKQNETKGKGLKILTPKQMFQRLPIALAQVKAGNNSENLLNEIRQIIYSLYQSKEITKKVYNNLIRSLQKMDTIFMNLENNKTSKPHVLTLKLTNKLDLRLNNKVIAISNLSIYYTSKNIKGTYNNNKFKISAPTWNEESKLSDRSYSISDIQYYFEYILKKHEEDIDKPPVLIYVNKIENRVTFKIKNGYSLELLTGETMKLLGSAKNKITTDENDENVPHLEITEVVLVHCNIVNNDYQQDSRVLYTFVPNKPFGSLLDISPANHIFLKTFNQNMMKL